MLKQEYIEFIGFFLGEGCLSIHKASNRSKNDPRPCYQPVIQISLRDDDRKILEWCHSEFGGHIYSFHPRQMKNGYINKPVCVWRLVGLQNCKKVIAILNQSLLPAKKKNEFKLFQEFLELKSRGKRHGFQGRWYSDEELNRQQEIKNSLSSLKLFT